MTTPVNTQHLEMRKAGDIFVETGTGFTDELRRVNTMMASLQTTWTGAASMSFNTAMDTWETTFDGIIKKLLGMAERMGLNVQAQTRGEDDAVDVARSFASALPGF
ncbi:WXG100 family type VII secretion target [Actinophytocola sp.]|uniref:WXG100 family type VII secretion target n=1 Tax=Actinophytocola sp. TaxID=1872138 RepID=UPI002D63D895|nr:WXG100 family type VII secretion target [Actinophytocola sp.]HYQ63781.1 WXG100 family type VII secretion target [Actinophytocola sp.]